MVNETDNLALIKLFSDYIGRLTNRDFDSFNVDINYNTKAEYPNSPERPVMVPGDEVINITLTMSKALKEQRWAAERAKHKEFMDMFEAFKIPEREWEEMQKDANNEPKKWTLEELLAKATNLDEDLATFVERLKQDEADSKLIDTIKNDPTTTFVDADEILPVDKGSLTFYHKGIPERRLEPLPDFENPELTELEQEFKERFDSGFEQAAPPNLQLKSIPKPEDVIE